LKSKLNAIDTNTIHLQQSVEKAFQRISALNATLEANAEKCAEMDISMQIECQEIQKKQFRFEQNFASQLVEVRQHTHEAVNTLKV